MDRSYNLVSFFGFATLFTVLTGSRVCPDTWTVFRDSCYLFDHGIALSFNEAEAFCQQHGGHLVHVNDAEENVFLKGNLRPLQPKDHWMGLSDQLVEKEWLWHDTNSTPEYTDWFPGEPTNSYHAKNEDCAEFRHTMDYQWNDQVCDDKNEAICEISGDDTQSILG